MLEELSCDCEGCGRTLDDAEPMLVVRMGRCERRAYECVCGAVTVTVVRD